jgi:hypothetical protein
VREKIVDSGKRQNERIKMMRQRARDTNSREWADDTQKRSGEEDHKAKRDRRGIGEKGAGRGGIERREEKTIWDRDKRLQTEPTTGSENRWTSSTTSWGNTDNYARRTEDDKEEEGKRIQEGTSKRRVRWWDVH